MTKPEPVSEWEASIFAFLEEPVPDAVRERARTMVTDVLAATVAGSEAEPYREAWERMDLPSGDATVIGSSRTTAPVQAAMLNGTAAIVQEIEEGHNTGGHVGSGIVTGGLAMAEHVDADGRTFVESCVKAYEICTRLEEAIFAMKARMNEAIPWLVRDPHATWTTVGPAVAAMLCTDPDSQTVWETFRLAANRAVVSMDDPYTSGPPSRNLTAGASAGVGVTMAQFAQAGVPGSGAAMSAVYDPFEELLPDGFDRLFADLGTRWSVTEHYVKPYPSCRYTHAPVDAIREIENTHEGSLEAETVERILVETYANAAEMDNHSPETLTAAKFSIPYVCARYLYDGSIELEHFSTEAIADEPVQSLADRVEIRIGEDYEAAFPEDWGARVTLEFADGSSAVGERAYPAGDYRDPMPADEFEARIETLLAYGLGDEAATTGLQRVLNPDEHDARAIGHALRE
ncbi:MmgE/PrpD family protein [Halobacteria archaeon AArc-curdl1]|uniref:MmgE/PrpD family protein n=1 Tax=Natronosalvus hydrolyticus TaxID=2979988 RepID=A0AAP2Z6Q5_9EURY|nr:MmgE/PrpD family protein [Halobacteria archaeon AArc-curdl1]